MISERILNLLNDDINSNPYGNGLTLNISEDDNSLNIQLVLSVAKHFRLKASEADMILTKVRSAVATWKDVATRYGLSQREREDMAAAFNLA